MEAPFANVLLTGPCNLRCPDCIGGRIDRPRQSSTLDQFPLPGFDEFCSALRRRSIRQVSVTGIDTEPMLYRHTESLVAALRHGVPGIQLSLHTNGTRVLDRLSIFHLYDRASISVPSLEPDTCRRMTGSSRVLQLREILTMSRIPIKLSILLTRHNRDEIPTLLRHVRELGYKRVVLRRLYGERHPYDPLPGLHPSRRFGGNPVYDLDGLEVTVWSFDEATLDCINLLPDGSVRSGYKLSEVVHG